MIKDWQRFKQLEQEKNSEAEQERRNLAKKLAMTCRSDDLDKELGPTNGVDKSLPKSKQDHDMEQIEQDFIQDEFFQEYLKKKLEEMHKNSVNL